MTTKQAKDLLKEKLGVNPSLDLQEALDSIPPKRRKYAIIETIKEAYKMGKLEESEDWRKNLKIELGS